MFEPNDFLRKLTFIFSALFAEYSCLFGISKGISQLEVGYTHICYGPGRSFIVAVGKGPTVYWFLIEKMRNRYELSKIPRFTEKDAIDTGEKYLDADITENTKFKDLWEKKGSAVKVAMEEGLVKKWHHSRCIALGDAVHKVNIM